jgi:4-hydroxy-3-methylbut-2-en-1-yl diphosphate reductase
MLILRAEELGMCFGVRDALAVLDAIERPSEVTIHGELVHNREVLSQLDQRGFHRSPERTRPIPATPVVLVTAHGISDQERDRLRLAGKRIVDTTCPLVHKVHLAAQALQRDGYRVLVIGKADHVEVRGITEDLHDAIVLGSLDDVRTWPERRLGIVCQTTTQETLATNILAAVRTANQQACVRFVDTVCSPTRARIAALQVLLPRIDALVVVGGRDSNNTRQLVTTGERHGLPTLHVEHADELSQDWFARFETIGLTAGTSTLGMTIDAVHTRLLAIAAAHDSWLSPHGQPAEPRRRRLV